MMHIRYLQKEDRAFWFQLDRHLPAREFERKIRDRMGYVILEDQQPIGLLRYHLFWDSIPFCSMLFIKADAQRKGYGKALLAHWEKDMESEGYQMVMTSTQANETAQHFYRKCGYRDAGSLLINLPPCAQPLELFLIKAISNDAEKIKENSR
ncbi:MAG: GNAT family N-acetyltransferase [Clostridiales bacterium]|nr:MAG: GNAT family N-acetyltransferase [Clostridiales bacterium]